MKSYTTQYLRAVRHLVTFVVDPVYQIFAQEPLYYVFHIWLHKPAVYKVHNNLVGWGLKRTHLG